MNLIETLKTSIYSPKNINNTKNDLNIPKTKKNVQQMGSNTSAFYADLYGIIYILCWGPHSLTSSFYMFGGVLVMIR